MSDAAQAQRADVFLFRARFFKSRALAARAVEGGAVRLDRDGMVRRLARASAGVRAGDRLVFMRGERIFTVEVLSLPDRRGPAAEARLCYRVSEREKDA